MKKIIALMLAIAVLAGTCMTALADSRVTWNGYAYQVFIDRGTWTEAYAKCKKAGGHLVTITSGAEQDFIFSQIKKHEGNVFWLGLRLAGSSWAWVTNEEFGYTNWADGQPDGDYGASYGTIYTMAQNWGIQAGQWDDCNDEWDEVCYICEWDKIPVESIKLNKTKATLKKGKTLQLRIKTIKPSNAANKSVKWKTSNKKVATVDKNGKVKAVGKGTCTITCTAKDGSKVSAKVTIKVK